MVCKIYLVKRDSFKECCAEIYALLSILSAFGDGNTRGARSLSVKLFSFAPFTQFSEKSMFDVKKDSV
mgnify:CR=1 FL=1